MLTRTVALTAFLCTATIAGVAAQAPGHGYVDDFGIEAPIVAVGNSFIATYYGWEATTVFGHELYVMTVAQYNADLGNGCFAFYSIYRASCLGVSNLDLGGLLGTDLFGRAYGVSCPVLAQACLGSPFSVPFTWTPGTEMVFALQVNQGIDGVFATPDYNWFFSGDPHRNTNADGQPSTGSGFRTSPSGQPLAAWGETGARARRSPAPPDARCSAGKTSGTPIAIGISTTPSSGWKATRLASPPR